MGHGRPTGDESLEVAERRAAARVERAREKFLGSGVREFVQGEFARIQRQRSELEAARSELPAGLRRKAVRLLERQAEGYRAMNSALLRLERVEPLDFDRSGRAVEAFHLAERRVRRALEDSEALADTAG